MKNKSLTAFLALGLGSLGVHRFYLGQSKYGWLYLGFCWTLVPLLLGFIDAIYFFSMSYTEFNRRYSLKHVFAKKFEDEEAIYSANFEAKREEEWLRKVEEMKNKDIIRMFLDAAKKDGNYLPRTAYARAKAILEDRPWKVESIVD